MRRRTQQAIRNAYDPTPRSLFVPITREQQVESWLAEKSRAAAG